MSRVEFKNIEKIFADGTIALQNFSLTIEDGEFAVLVGPSGCGKSTTLRLLAGLEEVTSGEMLIDGKRVNDMAPQERNIAMVFQNYALYPHMTVRGNLEFPLKMTRQPEKERREKVAEIAAMLDLASLLDRKPGQLSGGQRQRVAMGRALVRNPSVFLLDEPLSNLDARLRAQIRSEIAALQRRLGKTTLYVTHDQVEAMTLGDRVAVLQNGRLQQVGTPQELYDRPANCFVAGFIGSPGMNILPARILRLAEKRLTISVGSQQLLVTADAVTVQENMALQEGQSLHVGIRPEAFRTTPVDDAVSLSGVIDSIEFLGNESFIYLHVGDRETGQTPLRFIARLPGHVKEAPGNTMTISFALEALYLFRSH